MTLSSQATEKFADSPPRNGSQNGDDCGKTRIGCPLPGPQLSHLAASELNDERCSGIPIPLQPQPQQDLALSAAVFTARELEQATPELEERFTHSGCYKRQCMIAELAMGDLSYRQIGQKYGRPRTMSSNSLGTRRRSLRNGRGSMRNQGFVVMARSNTG